VIIRVKNWDIALAAGWGLLAFLHLSTDNFRYQSPVKTVGTAVFLGIACGVAISALLSYKTLKKIENKGVYSVSFSNVLFLFGGFAVFLGVFIWAITSLPLQSIIILGDFIYPMLPTAFLTRALFYSQWERKHSRFILSEGNFVGNLYAYPYIGEAQNPPNVSQGI
jgi:hypothetical protein